MNMIIQDADNGDDQGIIYLKVPPRPTPQSELVLEFEVQLIDAHGNSMTIPDLLEEYRRSMIKNI